LAKTVGEQNNMNWVSERTSKGHLVKKLQERVGQGNFFIRNAGRWGVPEGNQEGEPCEGLLQGIPVKKCAKELRTGYFQRTATKWADGVRTAHEDKGQKKYGCKGKGLLLNFGKGGRISEVKELRERPKFFVFVRGEVSC